MCTQAIKLEVVKKLRERFGSLYNDTNIMISATHTHSSPGGISGYIYDLFTPGFDSLNFDAITNGIVAAITKAHQNLRSATIRVAKGTLVGANINRSPSSWLANPEQERKSFSGHDTNRDHFVVRFDSVLQGKPLGMISWFSVHGTSFNSSNQFVSGDNLGYASALFEEYMNPKDSIPGTGEFVAAFAPLPCGDVSPNIKGTFCPDGKNCSSDSTCNGENTCVSKGPGNNGFENVAIIGKKLFNSAKKLFWSSKMIELKGPVDFRHAYVNFENITVDEKYSQTGKKAKTCRAAIGCSMLAGTTDGAGPFFKQGLNVSERSLIRNIFQMIRPPDEEQIECHKPKPIVLDMGGESNWVPTILPIQLFRIGQMFIAAMPSEPTTMAGKRLENQLHKTLKRCGVAGNDSFVIVSPLSNTYASYTTTFEEYAFQRYEAASTLFGPHQLS